MAGVGLVVAGAKVKADQRQLSWVNMASDGQGDQRRAQRCVEACGC